ncbi:MAG: redox-sensing transcriptional repressor Rex [Clostridia bacterium]|nr:redox-sensing transcriptional repressor Rex [Clostridia bacterium]
MEETNGIRSIPAQTLKRLPTYLTFLRGSACAGSAYVSAGKLAAALDRTEIQVRKDLAAVSTTGGKPKVGFARDALIRDIEDFLGLRNVDSAILAGADGFGRALLGYDGFKKCGITIVAAFDDDPALVGGSIGGAHILGMEKLTSLCKRLHIHIGVLCVPDEQAQQTAERMIEGGVLAIWNFTNVALQTPETVAVRNENLIDSLTLLLHELSQRMRADA